jgi:hypothetical protein
MYSLTLDILPPASVRYWLLHTAGKFHLDKSLEGSEMKHFSITAK